MKVGSDTALTYERKRDTNQLAGKFEDAAATAAGKAIRSQISLVVLFETELTSVCMRRDLERLVPGKLCKLTENRVCLLPPSYRRVSW